MKPFVRLLSFLLAFFVTLSIYILSYSMPQRKKILYEMYTNNTDDINKITDMNNMNDTNMNFLNEDEEIILSDTQKKNT